MHAQGWRLPMPQAHGHQHWVTLLPRLQRRDLAQPLALSPTC